MATTPKAGLRYPVSSDSSNIAQYFQNLASDVDTKVIIPVANQAARDALGTTGNLLVQRLDTGNIESNFGGSWNWVSGPLIQGKAWRTAGNGPTQVANVGTKVALDAARVTGGITFDNAGDQLVLPVSGHYDLRLKGYGIGGTGTASFRIARVRSAVADLEIVLSPVLRRVDASDEVVYAMDTLPLQAGDKIYLVCLVTATAIVYYGINEFAGLHLSARYVGPLAGATPV